MTKIKWVVIIYLVLSVVLALVSDLLGQLQSLMGHLGGSPGTVVRFLFDPTEYVWKWIVALLVTVVALTR